jgi:hypothetical protein
MLHETPTSGENVSLEALVDPSVAFIFQLEIDDLREFPRAFAEKRQREILSDPRRDPPRFAWIWIRSAATSIALSPENACGILTHTPPKCILIEKHVTSRSSRFSGKA